MEIHSGMTVPSCRRRPCWVLLTFHPPNVDSLVLGGARGTHAAVIAVRAVRTVVAERVAIVAFAVTAIAAGV